jgi:hypothetical protein
MPNGASKGLRNKAGRSCLSWTAAGIPARFRYRMKLMFDLHTLAYQCDLTHVVTFMVGQEFTGRTRPEIGVHDGHHATSHHQNDPVRLAKLVRINRSVFTIFSLDHDSDARFRGPGYALACKYAIILEP